MTRRPWTRQDLKLAFNLYCQLPFGSLHSRNAEIASLAHLIGRTPSSVAMKLVNFASLDPAITSTGRKGLKNASSQDREIWDEFNADWDKLVVECGLLMEDLRAKSEPAIRPAGTPTADYSGQTRLAIVQQRVRQDFFRRSVLSSYNQRCCMSGLSEPQLLVASHIKPWTQDTSNRLNPRNGLCLSALHDRAFDRGLVALDHELKVMVAHSLKRRRDEFARNVLVPLDGRKIELPERFAPDKAFLDWHRQFVFDRQAP